jgi:xylulokinase
MEYVLGIDIGSSATKVGLFDLNGTVKASASRTHSTREPSPGYREQDPQQWWEAAVSSIREAVGVVPGASIVGMGVAGHISSLTFVDSSGQPLRPAVGFRDLRAVAEAAEIQSIFGRQDLARRLGVDLPPAATWPLPRLLWFRKHEPRTLERAHRLLQAKDYVNFRLTGELASDASSNRGIVDLATGEAPHELFARLGLPESILPPLRDPAAVLGRVSAAASRETGLPEGLPVAAGWNDLNACVLGSGAVSCGRAFNITGSSEHIGVVVASQDHAPELVCAPFLAGRKLLYGVTCSGGGSLEWFRNAFQCEFDDLLREAASVPAGCHGLVFLPHLEGERAPIWDPSAAGAFAGIRSSHHRGHFVRAILEGVAFGLRQILELVAQNALMEPAPLLVSGGASRAALWNRIKTDVFERSTAVSDYPHAGALGAAMLGAVATGRYASCDEAAGAMARFNSVLEPDAAQASTYRASFDHYCRLYPALRGWFAAHGGLEALHVSAG